MRETKPNFRFKSVAYIFRAPIGTYFDLVENSYATAVCDICGKRKKCNYFECWCHNPIVGFDCCRTCRKQALVEE